MSGSRSRGVGRRVQERQRRREQQRRRDHGRLREHQRLIEEHRRRSARSARWSQRRRRMARWGLRIAIGGGAAVAVAVIVVVAVRLVGDALRPGPGHLPPMLSVSSYRADYVTVDSAGSPVTTIQEERLVARPYESLDLSKRDGQLIAGSITNEQGAYQYSQNNGWALVLSGRQAPQDDPQPYGGLAAGLKTGVARVTGSERLAGETCTVVRTGAPIGQPMVKPTDRNHVDVCLDGHGIILGYTWILNGKKVETMTAQDVRIDPQLTADDFSPGPKVDTSGALNTAPLTPSELTGTTPVLHAPPGFAYQSGTLLVQNNTSVGGGLDLTKQLLFLHGNGELFVVDYRSQPLSRTGRPVVLNAHHTGYLQLGLDTDALVVPNGPGASVQLTGPDPSLLLELARGLQ